MVQAEVFFLSSSRRSALDPEVKFRFKLGLGAAAGEGREEEAGDGSAALLTSLTRGELRRVDDGVDAEAGVPTET
jgi:hypothetical protein